MQELADAELVSHAAAGDREAFAALYERYFDRVYDFLARMMRNPDEAADVAQETFVKAMTSLGSLADGASFKSWLFTVARNTALNRIERAGRTQPLTSTTDDGEEVAFDLPDTDSSGHPEEALASAETAGLVWDAAKGMDPKQYSILDLHLRQGLESAEIAEVLGVTKNNGYVMLNRMKKSFEEAVRALVVLRTGPSQCAALKAALAPFTVLELSPASRKAIERHTKSCPSCTDRSSRVAPLAAFTGLLPLIAPAGLREQILQSAWSAQQASITAAGSLGSPAGAATAFPGGPGTSSIQSPGSPVALGTLPPAGAARPGDPERRRRRKRVLVGALGTAAVVALISMALLTSALTSGESVPAGITGTTGDATQSGSVGGATVSGTTGTAQAGNATPTPTPAVADGTPTNPPTSAIEPGATQQGLAPGGGGGTTATPRPVETPTPDTTTATPTGQSSPTPGGSATPSPCVRSLDVSPALLDYGTTLSVLRFAIRGEGCGSGIAFRAAETAGWLSLSRTSATTEPDGSVIIEVTVNRAALGVGTYAALIDVTWDGGVEQVTATVTIPSSTIVPPGGGSPSRTTRTAVPTTTTPVTPPPSPTPTCPTITCP